MEQDHQAAKAEDKAAGPRSRKKAPSQQLSSDAQRVFSLQRAAGNRAVSKMLGAPASAPTSSVTVQRDFNPSLEAALELKIEKSKFDINNFAEALVKLTGDTSTSAGTEKGKGKSGKSKSGTAPTKESVADRKKELAKKYSPQARKEAAAAKAENDKLDQYESHEENKVKFRDAEASLEKTAKQQGRRPAARLPDDQLNKMSVERLQDRVDDMEQEVKDNEERRKYMRKLRTPKMSSGQVSNLRSLI